MAEMYRCPNCGNSIPAEHARCRMCGYQSSAASMPPGYQLVLLSAKDDLRTLAVISKVTGEGLATARRILTSLPVIIYRSTDQQSVTTFAQALNQVGAETKVETMTGGEQAEMRQTQAPPPTRKRPSPLLRLVPLLIFFVAFILPRLMNNTNFSKVFKEIEAVTNPSADPFSEVEVIVAAKPIPAGHVITGDDLTTSRLDRHKLPEEALCPLEVDSLVGARIKTAVKKGDVIRSSSLVGENDSQQF